MKAKSAIAQKPRRSAAKRKPQIRKPETRKSQTRTSQVRGERAVVRRGDTTRLSILDAAERSFAESGFDGVSLRTITERAGVDLALANYHFGSKENLLHEVIARRVRLVHDDRVKALELARQQAGTQSPSVEAIVAAFLAPMFARLGNGDAAGAGSVGLLGLHVHARYHDPGDLGDRAYRAVVARALPLRRCRCGIARDGAFRQRRVARHGASGGGAARPCGRKSSRRKSSRRKRCDLKPCGIAKPSLRRRLSRINFDIFP